MDLEEISSLCLVAKANLTIAGHGQLMSLSQQRYDNVICNKDISNFFISFQIISL